MTSAAKNLIAPKVKTITESEITKFVLDRENYRRAAAAVAKAKTDIDAREKAIMAALLDGAKVQSKVYRVAIDNSQQARRPDWSAFLDAAWVKLGLVPKVERERIVQATEPTVYPHLTVEEIA